MAMTMADLMAKSLDKLVILNRGDQVFGKVSAISGKEIIVELGAKVDGVISKRDVPAEKLKDLKVGDSLQFFVVIPENDSGQAILSLQAVSDNLGSRRDQELGKKWQKFITARDRKTALNGKVVEINKGGLLVEIEGVRGFLPSSHISFDLISDHGGISGLVGESIVVNVIEIDLGNNRLIFSSRKNVSDETKQKLGKLEVGQKVMGKIVSVAPFGLLVSVDGLEGTVMSREISWSFDSAQDKDEDWMSQYEVGQEIEVLILAKDLILGKINLSIRQLSKDPFEEKAGRYQTDDVVTGEVLEITAEGIKIGLEDMEGFLPSDKIEGQDFQIGQKTNFLIDAVDLKKRKITLTPFLTSTKGLIYK